MWWSGVEQDRTAQTGVAVIVSLNYFNKIINVKMMNKRIEVKIAMKNITCAKYSTVKSEKEINISRNYNIDITGNNKAGITTNLNYTVGNQNTEVEKWLERKMKTQGMLME